MLGNLARSDEVCQLMVDVEEIHKRWSTCWKVRLEEASSTPRLGFLKNLAIAGGNRSKLGEAGIISAYLTY